MTDVQVTEPGQTISVAAGDRIVVTLDEPGATGFHWSVARLPDGLAVADDRYTPPGSGAPGAAGTRRIVLHATGDAQGTVELELRRPWEATAADRFPFSVDVARHQR